jgi:hypothetical protein
MWTNDRHANLQVLPVTDQDIEEKNESKREVGLFDLIVSIRKPQCEYTD